MRSRPTTDNSPLSFGLRDITCIPVSALKGDNVIERSSRIPWYDGPTLLSHLEEVPVEDRTAEQSFRMPVQWVNRPDLDFRGFAGLITSGTVRVGDEIAVLPSGQTSRVNRIATFDGDLDEAVAGQSVTLLLGDEIDISRGDLLCDPADLAGIADVFDAHVVWMHEEPLVPGRAYLAKIGTGVVGVSISPPKYRVNVNTLEHVAAKVLDLNEIGVCTVTTDRPIPFDPYLGHRDTGGMVLIDRITNATVGIGLLHFALRRVAECPLAVHRRHSRSSKRPHGSSSSHRVADWAVWCREVNHCEQGRAVSSRPGRSYLFARWRQRSSRAKS
jgi:bifunctional enzyme CysN/CysC